ncbi:MAG: oxygenase MpaB family protein, partial [Longimicrobiales bacterium]
AQTSKAIENATEELENATVQSASWLTSPVKLAAYNHLLEVAEFLATAPDLLAAPTSAASRQFMAYPTGFRDYFAPTPAPDWVDPDLLAKASKVWEGNMLFVLLTLFSGSLPYCYLDEKGIPLLYKTGKLTSPDYISQRLYETGLMLDAVMSRGGIRVELDLADQRRQVISSMLESGAKEISIPHDEHGRPDYSNAMAVKASGTGEMKSRGVETQADHSPQGARFLSGTGVLYAKKVRLLHAAMRYMAHEGPSQHEKPNGRRLFGHLRDYNWKAEHKHRVPINQEDLLYTLFTFGWVIPTGLKKWGRQPNHEETKAFLHCWKVTGYLMGIKEELLTDDPDEVAELFPRLVERLKPQKPSAASAGEDPPPYVQMTWAIADFLNNFLVPGAIRGLPYIMIEDQVGKEAAKTLLGDRRKLRPFTRLFYRVLIIGSKIHGALNRWVYSRSHLLQDFFDELMHQVGSAFIESWRDPFQRKPFTLPSELKKWRVKPGVTDEFTKRLNRWRQRMFVLLALSLIFLIGGTVVMAVGVLGSLFQDGWGRFEQGLLIGLPAFVVAALLMRVIVTFTARRRPALEVPIVLEEAPPTEDNC